MLSINNEFVREDEYLVIFLSLINWIKVYVNIIYAK